LKTSLFELFKIGIGPSSSHTVGPMRAAREFALGLGPDVQSIRVDLYGSLALTGKGHGTDRAVLLGLAGESPETVDTAKVAEPGPVPVEIVFNKDMALPGHPNAMRFTARPGPSVVYYSIGGGFIVREGEKADATDRCPVPYPFRSGAEMLAYGIPVWKLMLENEKAWHSEDEIRAYTARIWQAMRDSINRGLVTEGILPGGLKVRRRAPQLAQKLRERGSTDPLAVMDWVNVFAMAVNEENAAGGRVVTAPTNGASGLIPAVLEYYIRYQGVASEAHVAQEGIFRFLLTAAAIGVLYKENASISGAEVGCQGEVGVACSMAAGGLVAALRGTNDQVEHAAEIGMEHNLGMTCDPIGGLVQIPCIERNAIGAVKAINACRMAMQETGGHKVSLDQVIRTMYETGLDMQSRYKETSLAGLAVNAVEC
jgi:L-serine dehydratase